MPALEQIANTFEREIRKLASGSRYEGQIGEADIAALKRLFTDVIAAEETPVDGETLYQDIARFER
jgi:hypothetical protein